MCSKESVIEISALMALILQAKHICCNRAAASWKRAFLPCAKTRFSNRKVCAQLFKTNDIVTCSSRFVKFSEVNFSNTPIFFVEKIREAFAVQKLLSFCQQNISVYLVIKS